MNNIHISCYNFLPLVELLYLEDEVREDLLFLQDYKKIFNILEQIMKKRENRDKYRILKTFIPTYSNLFWRVNNDGYYYYEAVRQFLFDNEPIRPLIALSTKTKKWGILTDKDAFVTKTKRIELYPVLCAVIEKEVTLKENIDEDSIEELTTLIIRQSRDEAKKEKLKILNGLFTSLDKINVRLSDQLVITEYYEEKIKEKLSSTERKDIEKIGRRDTYLVVNNPMNISIIYTQKPVSKIMRKRLKNSVLAFYLVKFLMKRVYYILDKFYEGFAIKHKISLLLLFLVNLNPNNYGMYKAYALLHQDYQRKVFSFLARKTGQYKTFDELLSKFVTKVSKWDLYKQQLLFQNKNVAVEQFKELLNARDRRVIVKPKLSIKAEECLEYMLEKFCEADARWLALQTASSETAKPIGSISRNQLRTEFKKRFEKILEKRYREYFPSMTITDREMREKHPEFILELYKEGLIEIYETQRKPGEYRYYLDYTNPYIKHRIRELLV